MPSEEVQHLFEQLKVFEQLKAPFPEDRVYWRVGSTTKDKSRGLALAYIDARCVMDRLDEVVGPARWSDDYFAIGSSVMCRLAIRLPDGTWVDKVDGAGSTDVEAEKGAISDAFKRAGVKWGIGRYLYDLENIWVELKQQGNTHVIASAPKLPDWAKPQKAASQPRTAQEPRSTAAAPSAPPVREPGQGIFLRAMAEAKVRIGRPAYYAKLKALGYGKSTEVPSASWDQVLGTIGKTASLSDDANWTWTYGQMEKECLALKRGDTLGKLLARYGIMPHQVPSLDAARRVDLYSDIEHLINEGDTAQ